MIIIIIGLASIDGTLRKKTKNDEKIINRLDLIINELKNKKDDFKPKDS
jgi:hypothetical protein